MIFFRSFLKKSQLPNLVDVKQMKFHIYQALGHLIKKKSITQLGRCQANEVSYIPSSRPSDFMATRFIHGFQCVKENLL